LGPFEKVKADKNYEAEFTEKGTDYAVKFDGGGQWLESKVAVCRPLQAEVESAQHARFSHAR
jgi:hypothetical protein